MFSATTQSARSVSALRKPVANARANRYGRRLFLLFFIFFAYACLCANLGERCFSDVRGRYFSFLPHRERGLRVFCRRFSIAGIPVETVKATTGCRAFFVRGRGFFSVCARVLSSHRLIFSDTYPFFSLSLSKISNIVSSTLKTNKIEPSSKLRRRTRKRSSLRSKEGARNPATRRSAKMPPRPRKLA